MNKPFLLYLTSDIKFKKVLYVESLYSLALYLHIHKDQHNTLFLLGEKIVNKQLLEKLDNVVVVSKKVNLNDFEKLYIKLGGVPNKLREINSYLSKETEIYGHDHIRLSSFFFRKSGNIIEDGRENYKHPKFHKKHNKLQTAVKSFLNPCKLFPFGWNKRVKKIYLTGIEKVPSAIEHKVTLVNRKMFLNDLENLLDGVFVFDKKVAGSEQIVLILTQPLADDKIISRQEQHDIYQNISKSLSDKGFSVYIKPHPRDKLTYAIPKTTLIPAHILAESFYDSFPKIVSLFSSATMPELSTDKCELIHLGSLGIEKIEKKYGVLPCSNTHYLP